MANACTNVELMRFVAVQHAHDSKKFVLKVATKPDAGFNRGHVKVSLFGLAQHLDATIAVV